MRDFHCYLGFVFPEPMQYTTVHGKDWFLNLENMGFKPEQHKIPDSSDTLFSVLHKADRRDMQKIFDWLRDCVNAKKHQYPSDNVDGQIVVFLKSDWKSYKKGRFSSDVNILEKRKSISRRLGKDQYEARFVKNSDISKFISALDSHYFMDYSFGAKPPTHRPAPVGGHHTPAPAPHHHHPAPHHHPPAPAPSGGAHFSIGGFDISIGGITPTPHHAPAPAPHHHHHPPAPAPHHHHPPAPAVKHFAVNIDPNEPHRGFNNFPCYMGFILPVSIHHTTVNGNDWFTFLERINLKPKHQKVFGGTSSLFQQEALLSINYPCTRKDLGYALNWLNDCIDERRSQYSKEYQNGLVVLFLKEDWKLFKSKAMHSHIKLTEKAQKDDRKRVGPAFSVRYLPRANMNEFCTVWTNHYSNNYQYGKVAPCHRPEADPNTHYKPYKPTPAPQPYPTPGPSAPAGYPAPGYPPHAAPAPHAYPPHHAPAPAPHAYPPHHAPAPAPHAYPPHHAPAPAPHAYPPHGAPAPGPMAPSPHGVAPAPAHGYPPHGHHNPHAPHPPHGHHPHPPHGHHHQPHQPPHGRPY